MEQILAKVKPWAFETLGRGDLQNRRKYVKELLERISNVCDLQKAVETEECVYHNQHHAYMKKGGQHYCIAVVYRDIPRNPYLHKVMRYLFDEDFALARQKDDEDVHKYCACHKCVNEGRCINPSHIFIGTYKDNNRDIRGTKNGKSRYSEEDVLMIAGYRKEGKMPKQIQQMVSHVPIGTVWAICNGKEWSSVTGIQWTKQNRFYDKQEQRAIIRRLRTENPHWGGKRLRAHPSVKMPLATIHRYLRELREITHRKPIDCVENE